MHLVTLPCTHRKKVLKQKSTKPCQHFVFPTSLHLSGVSSWSGFSPTLPQFLCSQTTVAHPRLWPTTSSGLRFAVEEPDKKPESRFVLSGVGWSSWIISTGVPAAALVSLRVLFLLFKTWLRMVPCSRLHLGVQRAPLHFGDELLEVVGLRRGIWISGDISVACTKPWVSFLADKHQHGSSGREQEACLLEEDVGNQLQVLIQIQMCLPKYAASQNEAEI